MSGLRYTLVVVDPETAGPVALLAGQSVPEWAEGLVHVDDFEDPSEAPAAAKGQPEQQDGAGQSEPYEGVTIPDLKAEIEKRNEGRADEDKIPSTGNRPDLVAALVADDDKK